MEYERIGDKMQNGLENNGNEKKESKIKKIMIFILYLIAITIGYAVVLDTKSPLEAIIGTTLFGSIFGMYITLILFEISKDKREAKIRIEYEHEINELTKMKDDKNNYFLRLKDLNFKYYLQTQEHAANIFKLVIIVLIGGAIIIGSGISLMFFKLIKPAYITIATGAFCELMGSGFFYVYNKTTREMSQYHQKLVLVNNIIMSLSLIEEIKSEEKKDKSLELIIERLTVDINKHIAEK